MLQAKKLFKSRRINRVLDINSLNCLALLSLIKREFLISSSQGNLRSICEILLCEILGKERTQLYLENPILSREELGKFEFCLDSILSGMPLSFVLGKVDFFGLEFYLDEDCFIPRPETEILVEEVIDIAGTLGGQKVLIYDLCTGIGNIAISLTKSLTYCKIMATDISQQAIKFAYKNSCFHKVGEKIGFVCCDLANSISRQVKADIIVSNPPYIEPEDIDTLPENVRREPLVALEGGPAGLAIIRRLFEVCRFHLKRGGFLVFEFGHNQRKAIEEIADNFGTFNIKQIIKDYNDKNRIFVGRKR